MKNLFPGLETVGNLIKTTKIREKLGKIAEKQKKINTCHLDLGELNNLVSFPEARPEACSAISDVALVSVRYAAFHRPSRIFHFVRGYQSAEYTRIQINTGFGNVRSTNMAVSRDDEERIFFNRIVT